MATIRNLIVRISVTENTSTGIRKVTTSLRETNRELDSADQGANRFSGTLSRLGRTSLTGLTRGLGAIAKGTKLAAIGLTAVAAAAASLNTVVQAGTALAPLAGGLLLLPAVAVGAATALGTLKLAMSGVGDAFKAALGSGPQDPKKFAAALKDLTPAARGVAVELHNLRPELLGIKNTAQQNLFKPLTGQLTAMAKVLAGPLKQGVANVALQFGLAGRQVAEFARQSKSIELLKAAFGQTQLALGILRQALGPLLAGFRALATEGLAYLPKIAGAVATIAARFGDWLQKIVASGQATKWINNFFSTLKQLGGVLSNVGGILKSVFSAASAAGSGFLGVMGQALSKLNAFLKTASGQQALRSIFEGLGQIGQSLGPVIASLVKGLGSLAAPIGRLATMMGPILAAVIDALAPALAQLEPGLKALFGALGQAIGILAPVLPSVGKAISDIAVALAPVLPLAAGLAKVIADVLVAALKVLIPIIQPIVTAFSDALLPVLPQLSKSITDLVLALVPLAVALGPAFAKTITDLAPQFVNIATQLAVGLLPAFTDFINAIVPFIPDLVRLSAELGYLAVKILPPLLPYLIDLAKISLNLTTNILQLLPHLDGFVKILASIFTIGGIVQLLKNIGGAVGTVGDFIVGLPGKIYSALTWVIKNVPNAFSSAWNGAYNATKSVGGTVLRWIGGLPNAILRVFSGAGKWLVGVGKDIIYGLWNGIASLGNWIYNRMVALVKAVIPAPIRWALGIKSPSKVTTELGKFVGLGLVAGMQGTVSTVRNAASNLADASVPSLTQPAMFAAVGGGSAIPVPAGVAATMKTAPTRQSTETDARALAKAIKDALVGVGIHMDGKPVGQIVSRQLGQATDLRRRTG